MNTSSTSRVEKVRRRLANGERILIDGGTGTEIEKLGGSMVEGAWCGAASATHPAIVRQVHESYLRCGAEVIIANNFATARYVLEQAGWGNRVTELNRLGIQLAIEARDAVGRPDALVAGSIATTEQGYPAPPLDKLRQDLFEAAALQADAGADIIILEMMRAVDSTEIAIEAAESTGLPIWLGWSAIIEGGVPVLLKSQEPLAEATKWASDRGGIDLMAIMHTETADAEKCIDAIRSGWDGPIGVYAHTGDFIPPHWIFENTISPQDYTDAAAGWRQQGVQVFGGCCGIGPDHIEQMSSVI